MSAQDNLRRIQNIIDGVVRNPVARFSYTQAAIDNDIVDGVEVFDSGAEQNIPKSTETMYNPTVTDKGIRGQGASIPRMAWNHYVGRSSYNLNKLAQKSADMTALLSSAMRQNGFRYDSCAAYEEGDCCFEVSEGGDITWYQKNGTAAHCPVPLTPQYWDILTDAGTLLVISQLVDSLAAQIAALEGSAPNNIYENPFLIKFTDLDGVGLAEGNWNRPQARLEC